MLRYILVLLMVNASYRSLGNPISTAPVTLVNSMNTLADHCKNDFLSKQIKDKVSYCSDLTSPHGEKQLQCLMFYDINMQLCSAVDAQKLPLTQDDYTTTINEEQDVSVLCNSAKDWIFYNITEFARYKQAVDKVFQHPVTCSKICGVEDLMSDDSNFFCKYFKWGADVLKQAPVITAQENAQLAPEPAHNDIKDESSPDSGLQDVQVKGTGTLNSNTVSSDPLKNNAHTKVDVVKPETSSLASQKSLPAEPEKPPNVAGIPFVDGSVDTSVDNPEDTGAIPENNYGEELPIKSSEKSPVQTVLNAVTKPKAEENAQVKPDNVENEKELKTSNIKPQTDGEDYPGIDSEEGREGLPDGGGDDGDDPNAGDPAVELKPVQKADTTGYSFDGVKENPYAVQEDNDDRFFPFFLSAIVTVVILYVLYHNKSKLGKLFFGLMVEGRQAGRRRNSRGHAYRRLDTLEQAMSAGSTAPPSKIIY